MDTVTAALNSGKTIGGLTAGMKNYAYFHEAYSAVLGNFLGEYAVQPQPDASFSAKYGLKVFSPIASGYSYSHYKDFGASRSFGFSRRHLGNDLMGNIGTPVIAVEGGYIECIGWNYYGGWRIGIRSFDHKRYYYYAHLQKNHPYAEGLTNGSIVHSGDVIGYLGMTGYSNQENVNKMEKPHLHFGMELVFDESQKESNNEIWIDVYNIVNLLYNNRSKVQKEPGGKEFHRALGFIDSKYMAYYQ